MPRDARIPVIIVSGFLGSGKTTLLKKVLATPELSGSMLIVNEIGAIGIDQRLLEHSADSTILLDNGCVCCQLRGELQALLVDLLMRRKRGDIPSFDRVIIETSGLSEPGAIARSLYGDNALARSYRLAHVVTLIDPTNRTGRDAAAEVALGQVASADLLIITKVDRASAAEVAAAEQWARDSNGHAPLIHAAHGEMDIALIADATPFDDMLRPRSMTPPSARRLFRRLGDDASHPERAADAGSADEVAGGSYLRRVAGAHPSEVRSFVMEFELGLDRRLFELFLETLTRLRGDDLLRVKGILFFASEPEPQLIQGVGKVFDKPVALGTGVSVPAKGSLVFITRAVTQHDIEQLWSAVGALSPPSTGIALPKEK